MKNGTCWKDTDGKLIQAHGGVIVEHEGTYYWYGEYKDNDTCNGRVDFVGFSCYSSKNLMDWKNEGLVFQGVGNVAGHELSSSNVGERPKVVYNKVTQKFVRWFHLDSPGYNFARIGVASADSPVGPFTYLGNLWPDSQQSPCGRDSRDMTLFQEEDGTAYLVCSSDWNSNTIIAKLDATYTKLTGDMKVILMEQYREAPVVIKEGGIYYLFSSGCTGWAPNSMLYAIATAPMGTYRLIDNPCSGPDARKTFYGQTANAFKKDNQWYIMLDHWNSDNLRESGYSFLPIHIEGTYVEIPWVDEITV